MYKLRFAATAIVVTLRTRWWHEFWIYDRRESLVPALSESGCVGCADYIAHGAAGAVVEDEACGWGEVDVGFVPEVGADCAGGVVGDGGVDSSEELRTDS